MNFINSISNIYKYVFITFFLTIIYSYPTNSSEQNFSAQQLIEKFFKNLQTLEADFIQVSPSGMISNGKLFLELPGKLRIDYKKPNNLLITCKGFWIVIQNRKLKVTNNLPLDQTPLFILLNKKIQFDNQSLDFSLKKNTGVIELRIKQSGKEDSGELFLEFIENPFDLKKWIIIDPNGQKTTVLIQNARYNIKIPHTLFFPEDFPELNN